MDFALATPVSDKDDLDRSSIAFGALSLGSPQPSPITLGAISDFVLEQLDADLSAIAQLTTNAFGRSVLAWSNAAAGTAALNAFTGDAGSGGLKGMVPAPATGDAAAGKFLAAGGGWAVPPTSPPGGSSGQMQVNNAGAFGGSYIWQSTNVLDVRNGANAQTLNLYQTYTDGSNYARLAASYDVGNNRWDLVTQQAGTGSATNMRVGVIGTAALWFVTNNSDRWQITSGGHFLAGADNTYDIGASAATRPRSIYVGTNVSYGGSILPTAAGSQVAIGQSGVLYWNTRTTISSAADGVIMLGNLAQTDFARLQFGGTTSSFPALKRSSAALEVRLADDSGYAALAAAAGTFSGSISQTTAASAHLRGGIRVSSGMGSYDTALSWQGTGYIAASANGVIGFTSSASDGTATVDVALSRDGANIFAQRNGANAQAHNLYNTYTDGSNYERFATLWSGNVLYLRNQNAGTGSNRAIAIDAADIYFQTGGGSRWQIQNVGHLLATADNTYDIGASGASRPRSIYIGSSAYINGASITTNSFNFGGAGGRLYVDANGLLIDSLAATRINLGGLTSSFPAIKRNSTGIDFRLADDSAYAPITASIYNVPGANSGQIYGSGGSLTIANGGAGIILTGTTYVTNFVVGYSGNGSAYLSTDGANILAQRNGANAQKFNIYNTYTDGSNFEAGFIRWESNILQIGTGKAGTGSARELQLVTDFTARWRVDASGHLLAATDNAYDIGGSGAARPRNIQVGTSITVPTLVATTQVTLPNTRGVIKSGSNDGDILLHNSNGTSFGLLALGGLTSSFPAVKRNSAALNFRLADDSADAAITAGTGAFSGKLTTAASATGGAGLILPHGTAPTSPVNGDVWTTTAGMYARINGSTVGPFGAGGGGGSPGGSSGQLQYNASSSFDGANIWQGTNVLDVRNSTNAQTLNLYNTYTDGSNYERAGLFWSGNVFLIETQKLGTGAARNLYLSRDGGNQFILGPSNISLATHLVFGSDNTHDIGASGANRPRSIHVGTQFVGATGIQSAPSYTFTGNTTTGLYSWSSSPAFTVGGAITYYFSSTYLNTTAGIAFGSATAQGDTLFGRAATATLQHGAADTNATTTALSSITIASPGVFTTSAAHGLSVGTPLKLSTTGALPTGLAAATQYYVATVPSSTTYTVTATLGGSPINTSGTQSGTHSQIVAPISQYDRVQSAVTGTDLVGASRFIQGSVGTGAGAGGSIIFQVAPAGSTGASQNAYASVLTLNASKQVILTGGLILDNYTDTSTITLRNPNGVTTSIKAIGSDTRTTTLRFNNNSLQGDNARFESFIDAPPAGGHFAAWNGNATTSYFQLHGEAAHTLAQRNGTNAQTFNVYETYTDGSNYARFKISYSGGYWLVGSDAAGTGNNRNLALRGADILFQNNTGTSWWNITSTGHFLAGTDNAYDIGASGATRPRNVYVGTSVVAGGNLTASGNVIAGAAQYIYFNGRSCFSSASDGVLCISNNAVSDFARLQFGGTTSSFPAIKRSGAGLHVRLADDSDYAALTVGSLSINGINPLTQGAGINTQTASYTLVLADAGKMVEMNVGSGNNLTVPNNSSVAYPVGTLIDISQYGAGQTTIVPDSGVTIRSSGGKLKLSGQYSGATLQKRGTNEWMLFGDLTT